MRPIPSRFICLAVFICMLSVSPVQAFATDAVAGEGESATQSTLSESVFTTANTAATTTATTDSTTVGSISATSGNSEGEGESAAADTSGKAASPPDTTETSPTTTTATGTSSIPTSTSGSTKDAAAGTNTTEDAAPGVEEGVYEITSAISGEALDIADGSTASGANVQIWDDNSTQAQRWRIEKSGDSYCVVNAITGNALDVEGADMAPSTNVQSYSPNGTTAQLWDFVKNSSGGYSLRSVLSGLMLDVAGASSTAGTNVQVYTDNGTAAQCWLLSQVKSTVSDGVYIIGSTVDTTKLIDVDGGSFDNGANVQLYTANNSIAQKWSVAYDDSNGYYVVSAAVSGDVIDIPGANTSEGTGLWQYAKNGTAAQLWSIRSNSDGTVTFVSALTGLVIDTPSANASDGQRLQMWDPNDSAAQHWSLTAVTNLLSDGLYQLASGKDASLVVDVSGGSTTSDAAVQVWEKNGTLAQKWVITLDDDGTYSLMNANSGLYLTDDSGSVAQEEPTSRTAFRWRLSLGTTGGLVFTSVSSGKVIDLAGGITAAGTLVQTYVANGTAVQSWRPIGTVALEDGYYVIYSRTNSSECLDVPGGSFVEGTAVQLYDANGSNAQKWAVKSMGDGLYSITSVRSGDVLDVEGASATSGTTVQQWLRNGSSAQRWSISIGESGGLVIKSALGDLNLSTVDDAIASSGSSVCISAASDAVAQLWSASSSTFDAFTVIRDLIQSGCDRNHDGINLIGGVSSLSQSTTDAIDSAIDAFTSNGYSVGFVMEDLTTGSGVTYDADGSFYSASTVKAPFCTYLLHLMDYGIIDSTAYDLISNTIIWSSNDAYASLRQNYSWVYDGYASWLEDAGDSGSFSYNNYNWYSARDLSKMWNQISSYFSSSSNGSWISELTEDTCYSPIRDALGWKATVHNKAGWYPQSYPYTADNDSALVECDGHPYLLTILSNAPAYSSLLQGLASALDTAHQEIISI